MSPAASFFIGLLVGILVVVAVGVALYFLGYLHFGKIATLAATWLKTNTYTGSIGDDTIPVSFTQSATGATVVFGGDSHIPATNVAFTIADKKTHLTASLKGVDAKDNIDFQVIQTPTPDVIMSYTPSNDTAGDRKLLVDFSNIGATHPPSSVWPSALLKTSADSYTYDATAGTIISTP